jgi:transposase-like protein
MGQKSGSVKQPKVPPACNGININRCATPSCPNFNTPIQADHDPNYLIVSAGKNTSAMQCQACNRYYTIKSNHAVSEELDRFQHHHVIKNVYRQDGLCCHSEQCSNFGLLITQHPSRYRKRGITSEGHQRFQCKDCLKTFTNGSNKRRSHPNSKNYDNVWLFKQLVNQTGINRCMELTGLSSQTIYRKIDMFYERCLFFLQERESRLRDMELPFMRLSTDRQEYQVNWSQRRDKRFVVVSAIGSADKASRYVFGMDVNFDDSLDLNMLAESGVIQADSTLKDFNRRFARVWTHADYARATSSTERFRNKQKQALDSYLNVRNIPLTEAALEYIRDEIEREHGIVPNEQTADTKLPLTGTLIHSEYTMHAHFRHLENLIGHAGGLRFYLDQEQGINRACALAFAGQVTNGRCHIAYTRINKELTVDERRFRVAMTKRIVEEMIATGQALDERHAHRVLVQRSLTTPFMFNKVNDPWYFIPIHHIYEADKYVCPLTDSGMLHQDDLISMLLDASLHPIDNFFQMVRRRLSLLERPVHTRSNSGLVWTGKSPYNPEMVHKLLQILRTYYNYCFVGKQSKTTPAQRLGLAKGVVEIRKILYPNQ